MTHNSGNTGSNLLLTRLEAEMRQGTPKPTGTASAPKRKNHFDVTGHRVREKFPVLAM